MSIISEAFKKDSLLKAFFGEEIYFHHSQKGLHPHFLIWMISGAIILVVFSFFASRQDLNRSSSLPKKDVTMPLKAPPPFIKKVSKKPSLSLPVVAKLDIKKKVENRALTEGLNFYRRGKIHEAYASFSKAVLQMPQSPIAHNNLGLVLRRKEKTHEAILHYQEAIRLDVNYAEAYNNLAMVYGELGLLDRAEDYYKKAIRLKPTDPVFYFNHATLLERRGEYTQARNAYLRYLNLTDDKEAIAMVRSHLERLKGS